MTRLENAADIFPEIKTMERVKGLEETSQRMLTIYRRLNKAHIDLERVSYQFCDDRDALTSALRRFLQGRSTAVLNIDKSSRPKIVFDDSTFTFYEIKELPEKQNEEKSPEEISEEDKLELHEFLGKEVEPLVEVDDGIGLIDVSAHKEVKEISEHEAVNESIMPVSDLEKEETEIINLDKKEQIDNGQFQHDKTEEQEHELSLFDDENIETEAFSPIIAESEKNSEFELVDNDAESDEETIDEPTTQKEFILREELGDREGTFHRESRKSSDERPKTDEEIFYEFETSLVDNIKELDDYLGKITTSSYDENREEELITQAYKSLTTAESLGHEVIAKMIKTYWAALLAMRDKKLPATKNEAELIRSTLIIIVALIKDKDIELESYWENHNYLVKKLTDLSYEV